MNCPSNADREHSARAFSCAGERSGQWNLSGLKLRQGITILADPIDLPESDGAMVEELTEFVRRVVEIHT
jgi:hypothetical protein